MICSLTDLQWQYPNGCSAFGKAFRHTQSLIRLSPIEPAVIVRLAGTPGRLVRSAEADHPCSNASMYRMSDAWWAGPGLLEAIGAIQPAPVHPSGSHLRKPRLR